MPTGSIPSHFSQSSVAYRRQEAHVAFLPLPLLAQVLPSVFLLYSQVYPALWRGCIPVAGWLVEMGVVRISCAAGRTRHPHQLDKSVFLGGGLLVLRFTWSFLCWNRCGDAELGILFQVNY